MSKEYAKDDDFSETKIAHLFIGPWLSQFYYLVINWVFQVKFKFIFNKLNGLRGKSLFINKLKCKRYQWEKNNGEQKTLELWTEVNIAEEIWKKNSEYIYPCVFQEENYENDNLQKGNEKSFKTWPNISKVLKKYF